MKTLKIAAASIALTASINANAASIFTDSSWSVTASSPVGDWNTSLAFDDSNWQSATTISTVGGYDANVIWTSGGQFSTTETQIWGRYTFNITSQVTSAIWNSGFDDDGQVYINGTLVINDNNGNATGISNLDITQYLVTGENLIAFSAQDNIRWGYNHGMWAQVDIETVSAVPVPAAVWLFGSGLMGLVGIARRRNAS